MLNIPTLCVLHVNIYISLSAVEKMITCIHSMSMKNITYILAFVGLPSYVVEEKRICGSIFCNSLCCVNEEMLRIFAPFVKVFFFFLPQKSKQMLNLIYDCVLVVCVHVCRFPCEMLFIVKICKHLP